MKSESLMGYLGDYLRWRGDLTFDQAPFCDADSLALTMLCFAVITSAMMAVNMLLITLLTGLYLSNQTLTEADPLLLLKMMRMVFVIFLLFCILGFFMAKKRKMW